MASNYAATTPAIPAAKQIDRPYRPSKPNYKQIHALPLPIKIFPLPALIPHNPFSVLSIALTYLFQLVAQPSSHAHPLYQGYLSPRTCSVHVTDEATIRVLWEQGFFGKGNLSRSEPSWLDRERRRKGVNANETSEEVTRRRREERKMFKKERARKEREAIEEQLEEEAKQVVNGNVNGTNNQTQDENTGSKPPNGPTGGKLPSSLEARSGEPVNTGSNSRDLAERESSTEENLAPKALNQPHNSSSNEKPNSPAVDTTVNQEHLQLTPEEAFFLVYGLGILGILSPNPETATATIPTASLFTHFRQTSYFPPHPAAQLQPDDPFLLSYVVYHHFRSLGWVVRPGIKFAVDYLLYNRGPVFSHAEFAVLILPAYSHAYWRSSGSDNAKAARQAGRSWTWLHCVNRVQSQVRKSLLLVYVDVPPPPPLVGASSTEGSTFPIEGSAPSIEEKKTMSDSEPDIDITRLLQRYRIRELTLRRWTPNRSRD